MSQNDLLPPNDKSSGPSQVPADTAVPTESGNTGEESVDRPVRLTDVAAAAGVSAATVSQVLNGRRPVAEDTRRRVRDAVERLDYRPNQLARGLRTRQTNLTALVIPDITNPFYPVLARGMQDMLGPAGIHTMVSNDDTPERSAAEFFADLVARGVDGIVTTCFHITPADLEAVTRAEVPLVRLGTWRRQPGRKQGSADGQNQGAAGGDGSGPDDPRFGDIVQSNDREAAATAVEFLLRRGHTRIGMISASSVVGNRDDRAAGYRDALRRNRIGLDDSLFATGDYGRDSGREAMHGLLSLPNPPQAVFCANDLMAIGALDAARERGRQVPADVAIVGFDDIDAASLVTPRLTTVRNPARRLGRACGERLLERVQHVRSAPTETWVSAELVVREST